MKKIKLLALDIDGVLTDGRTTLGARTPERKRLAFQDLDAINAARRAGLRLALVTGESDGSVDLVAARTGVETVRRGAKDKLSALQAIAAEMKLSLAEICYVGDGDRDAPALAAVGLSFAPKNATFAARQAAHRQLRGGGGHGAVNEAVRLVLRLNAEAPRAKFIERELAKAVRAKKIPAREVKALASLAGEVIHAIETGRKILLSGNEAAAALAELSRSKLAWPAVVLSDHPRTRAGQLRVLARPGDVVVEFLSKKAGGAPAEGRDEIEVFRHVFRGDASLTAWSALAAVAEQFLRRRV